METFYETVKKRFIETANSGRLTREECAVVQLVWETRKGGRVSQTEIAKSAPWIGAHPNHDKLTGETTLRMVRQVIRDLRVNHHLPILADRNGYFIPRTTMQADEYLCSMEREARARAASSLETYRAMRDILGMRSAFFDAMEATPSEPSATSPS